MINLSKLLQERLLNGDEDEGDEGGSHGGFAASIINLPPEAFNEDGTPMHAPQHPLLAGKRQFSGISGRQERGHSNLNPDASKNEHALQNRLQHQLGNRLSAAPTLQRH